MIYGQARSLGSCLRCFEYRRLLHILKPLHFYFSLRIYPHISIPKQYASPWSLSLWADHHRDQVDAFGAGIFPLPTLFLKLPVLTGIRCIFLGRVPLFGLQAGERERIQHERPRGEQGCHHHRTRKGVPCCSCVGEYRCARFFISYGSYSSHFRQCDVCSAATAGVPS
jgi:hypothetical protein